MLDNYSLNDKYLLPITSTLRAKVTPFVLDLALAGAQLKFASLHDVSMFHVGLACYFLLAYELNDSTTTDLCATGPTDNQSLANTKLITGTFSNLLSYRIQHPYQQIIDGTSLLITTGYMVMTLLVMTRKHCQILINVFKIFFYKFLLKTSISLDSSQLSKELEIFPFYQQLASATK